MKREIQEARKYFENETDTHVWFHRITDIPLCRVLFADLNRWKGQVSSWSEGEFRLETEFAATLELEIKETSCMVLISLSREKSRPSYLKGQPEQQHGK